MASTTVETVLPAPRGVVYRLFADRDSFNAYMPTKFTLRTPGAGEPSGVGARYLVGIGGVGITEETTVLVPDERIEYKIVAGAPVKRHIGIITFADAPGGTTVSYTMESYPKFPVPDRVIEIALRGMIKPILAAARKAVTKK